jgi:asparagine synthase (glutamine-hydrolysing)
MSGITGFWQRDGGPARPEILDRMSEALSHRGPDGEGRRAAPSALLACRHLWVTPEEIGERQPVVAPTGAMLVLDGRIDNRQELLERLELPPTVSDAVSVLAAYDVWGDAFPEHLNGDFAVALYDGSRKRLLLARDALGMRPLYYFTVGSTVGFASEIKALLEHPDAKREIDPEGLADFLLMSSRPLDGQETTCFAGILAVKAAHIVIATPDAITVRRYWDFETGSSITLRSFDDYSDALQERFEEAVRRRLRCARPVAVSLSGGLDSSSIFCQAVRLVRSGKAAAPDVIGISYVGRAGTDADEERFLTHIERHYGVAIDRFPLESHAGLLTGIDEQIAAIEAPLLDYMWGVTREVHRRAADHRARVLLSGTWGDQMLFSSAYLVDLLSSGAWVTLTEHLRKYRRWLGAPAARQILRTFALDAGREYTPRPLLPALKRLRLRISPPGRPKQWFSDAFLVRALRFADRPALLGDGFRTAHARSIYIEARSKYHVHCMEWNNKVLALRGLDASLPFLDRDLVAFMMAIPGEIQNWKGVPRGLMRAAMRGILPEPIRTRVWKADFTAAVNTSVEQDVATVASMLPPDCLGVRMGFLDGARLGAEVQTLAAGLQRADCLDSWSLADLFGLEMWLRVFFGRDHSYAASDGFRGALT